MNLVIPNAEGKRTTPSVIAFVEGGEIKVGDLKRQAVTNPTKTIASVKDLWVISSVNQKDAERSAYKVVKGDNDTARVDIDGRLYSSRIVNNGSSKNEENCRRLFREFC